MKRKFKVRSVSVYYSLENAQMQETTCEQLYFLFLLEFQSKIHPRKREKTVSWIAVFVM